MKFMIEFAYEPSQRENTLRHLHDGGLLEDGVTVKGAWLAVQTGLGFAVLETEDAAALYQLCSRWSDYGELQVYPVVDAKQI